MPKLLMTCEALWSVGRGRCLHGGARAAHGVQALVQLRAKALGAHQGAQAVGVQVAHHHLGFHLQAQGAHIPRSRVSRLDAGLAVLPYATCASCVHSEDRAQCVRLGTLP